MEDVNYYRKLGIDRAASGEQITSAFRALAMKYHPDKNKSPGARALFIDIREAYEILIDPTKRAAYDRLRFKSRPTQQADTTETSSKTPNQAHSNQGQSFNEAWRQQARKQAKREASIPYADFIKKLLMGAAAVGIEAGGGLLMGLISGTTQILALAAPGIGIMVAFFSGESRPFLLALQVPAAVAWAIYLLRINRSLPAGKPLWDFEDLREVGPRRGMFGWLAAYVALTLATIAMCFASLSAEREAKWGNLGITVKATVISVSERETFGRRGRLSKLFTNTVEYDGHTSTVGGPGLYPGAKLTVRYLKTSPKTVIRLR